MLRRARQVVAQWIWAAARWMYPYDTPEYDASTVKIWDINAAFTGTEAQANVIFDRVVELTCDNPGHHRIESCNFVVGGMRSSSLDDPEAPDLPTEDPS